MVKDTILDGGSEDLVLVKLLELALTDIQGGRPLFRNGMEEPIFYRRYFRRWVQEGLQEREAIHASQEAAVTTALSEPS